MARPSRGFAQYPQWVIGAIAGMLRGEEILQISVAGGRKDAFAMSMMLNRGKLAFVRDLQKGGEEGLQAMILAGLHTQQMSRAQAAEIALDIVCRVTNLAPSGLQGKYILEIVRRGLAVEADEARGAESKFAMPEIQVPGIDQAPEPASPQGLEALRKIGLLEDPTEQYFANFLKGGKSGAEQGRAPEPSASKPPCQHELDSSGARCLHCGLPADELKKNT